MININIDDKNYALSFLAGKIFHWVIQDSVAIKYKRILNNRLMQGNARYGYVSNSLRMQCVFLLIEIGNLVW